MRYPFAAAMNIADFLPAIDGRAEFVIKRDAAAGIAVINYLYRTPESFPDPAGCATVAEARLMALRRDCRGIKFDLASGDLISRPYHKFFNVNEQPETQAGAIDWSQPHWVLSKTDGSMVTPHRHPDGIAWHTKMGPTPVAAPVGQFVADSDLPYRPFCDDAMRTGWTPIFEWCSRRQRIVLDYPVDQLLLTAIRYTHAGGYMAYDQMCNVADDYGLPVVGSLSSKVTDVQRFLRETAQQENIEGWVVRFADGHMVKVKCDWYVSIHGAKDMLSQEKSVWALVLDDRVDDLLPLLPDADRKAVEGFAGELAASIATLADRLSATVLAAREAIGEDRKRFAMDWVMRPSVPICLRGPLFAIWQGQHPVQAVRGFVAKQTGTITAIDAVRHLLGNLSWWRFYSGVADDAPPAALAVTTHGPM